VCFTPTAPTNHLKLDPWWDDECRSVTNEVRGVMKNGKTLFLVPKTHVPQINRGIKRWLYQAGSERG